MRIPTLALLSTGTAADDRVALAAPRPGTFVLHVEAGQVISGGMSVGKLMVLNRRYSLVLPEGLGVRIARVDVPRGQSGVGYATPLLELQVGMLAAEEGAAPLASEIDDLPEGAEIFRAPIEGQFYRRPAPDAPPFVAPGDVVEPGATLGLIEVMKFFHPVLLEGQGARRVERFLAEDGQPVDSGTALLVLLP